MIHQHWVTNRAAEEQITWGMTSSARSSLPEIKCDPEEAEEALLEETLPISMTRRSADYYQHNSTFTHYNLYTG